MKTSLHGQWFGYFSYGPEYGPELEGETVIFSFLIEEGASGQFKGKCIELHGIGASEEVSFIKGFMEDGFVSFTKEYNTYTVMDEQGRETNYEGALTPRLSYKGYYDPVTEIVSGSWELWANEVPYGDGTFVDVCTGKWEMSRHAETYGI